MPPITFIRRVNGTRIFAEYVNVIQDAVEDLWPAAEGELIVGSAAGAPARLAVGATDELPTIVNGTIVWQSRERVNLRSHLSLAGTDQAAALQTLITGLSAGKVLVLDHNANLGLGAQVAWSGKRLDLVGMGDAVITQLADLTVPMIAGTSAHKSQVGGFAVAGSEVAASTVTNNTRYAIQFVTSDDVAVEAVRIANKTRGVHFSTCARPRLRDVDFVGMATGFVTDVKEHTACFVQGGADADIAGLSARNVGSALLIGSTAQRGKASRIVGRNCFDNGIYISSGDGWTISQASILMDTGLVYGSDTGIKMRGSGNTVAQSYAEGVLTGYVLSPYETTPDAFGASASDSAVVDSEAFRCRGPGAFIDQADASNRPRDFQLIGVRARECGQALGADAAIRVIHGNRHTIALCQVIDHKANGHGILVGGAVGEILTGIMVALCKVRNSAGGASAFGMQLSFADFCTVFGLELFDITTAAYGLRLVTANNNQIHGLKAFGTVGTTAAIRINAADCNTNRVYDNPTCTISDVGTGTIKYGNASGNPTVTGSRGGNAALADLLTKLAAQQRIVDGTVV